MFLVTDTSLLLRIPGPREAQFNYTSDMIRNKDAVSECANAVMPGLILCLIWFTTLSCLVFVSTPVHAKGMWDKLSMFADKANITGYLRNETAFRYLEPRAFTKIRNTLYLRSEYRINDWMDLTAAGRAYYDLAYQITDYDTIAARSERDYLQPLNYIEQLAEQKDSDVVELRELYLDMYLDKMDIRLGKQFVVWGVMTGVRVVDEINPMDFRELILPDLLDYRIPLWTAKVDYYLGDSAIQLLWIPDIKFHKPAPPGSEWELLQEVPGTTYPESFKPENSEFGVRLSSTVMDTEVTLSYFYTWDDFPVIFRKVPVNVTVVDGAIEEPVFFPTYTRISIYGATFQRPVGSTIVKGEFAYVQGKYFGISAIDRNNDGYIDNQGELQADHIRWALGVDFNLWKTDFSPGFLQWLVLNHDPAMIQPKIDNSFNLFVRKEFPEQRAVFTLLYLYLITLDEMYIKPKITFNVTDHFQVAAGFDIFTGLPSQTGVAARDGKAVDLVEIEQRYQFIGNFHSNDRLFLEFQYNF